MEKERQSKLKKVEIMAGDDDDPENSDDSLSTDSSLDDEYIDID